MKVKTNVKAGQVQVFQVNQTGANNQVNTFTF